MSTRDIPDIRATLETLRRGALTKRYHGFSTIEGQNVGHHSHSVGILLWLITGGTTGYHMMAALTHDMGEYIVGDLPSPTKRALGDAARAQIDDLEKNVLAAASLDFLELSPEEQQQLKLADIFDGLLFCITERSLGNQNIRGAYYTYRDYAEHAVDKNNERHACIFRALQTMWRQVDEQR